MGIPKQTRSNYTLHGDSSRYLSFTNSTTFDTMAGSGHKLLLIVAVTYFISEVASLDCYVCVPPKYKGTRSPPCEFDAHDWGVLETCPQQSNVCIASVQEYQGVTVHVRECGEMKGGIYDIQDHCVQELTDKTTGYICACHTDGCNKGLGNSAKTAQLNSIFLILASLAAWLLYFR